MHLDTYHPAAPGSPEQVSVYLPAPHRCLFRDKSEEGFVRLPQEAQPAFCHTTSSHPSVDDCRPSNWSLHTARSGHHPQWESDKVPKWGHFQQLLFPALKPPTLK